MLSSLSMTRSWLAEVCTDFCRISMPSLYVLRTRRMSFRSASYTCYLSSSSPFILPSKVSLPLNSSEMVSMWWFCSFVLSTCLIRPFEGSHSLCRRACYAAISSSWGRFSTSVRFYSVKRRSNLPKIWLRRLLMSWFRSWEFLMPLETSPSHVF